MVFFFFSSRRRHTRWNCDWSSDVCSSDLGWGRRSPNEADLPVRCERPDEAVHPRPGGGGSERAHRVQARGTMKPKSFMHRRVRGGTPKGAWEPRRPGDKLALEAGQCLVELAEGERQCCHFISNRKVTSRCTSNFAISCARWCMPVICAPATASRRAANSRPCWAFIAQRWRTPTPSWNPKG